MFSSVYLMCKYCVVSDSNQQRKYFCDQNICNTKCIGIKLLNSGMCI